MANFLLRPSPFTFQPKVWFIFALWSNWVGSLSMKLGIVEWTMLLPNWVVKEIVCFISMVRVFLQQGVEQHSGPISILKSGEKVVRFLIEITRGDLTLLLIVQVVTVITQCRKMAKHNRTDIYRSIANYSYNFHTLSCTLYILIYAIWM